VTLTKLRNTFYMTVSDSGIGFNIRAKSEGLGLVSMRERLTLVNGRLRVRWSIGGGTEIWVSIPDKPHPSLVDGEEAEAGTVCEMTVPPEPGEKDGWLRRNRAAC
jgi:signal transduction histidine kinase